MTRVWMIPSYPTPPRTTNNNLIRITILSVGLAEPDGSYLSNLRFEVKAVQVDIRWTLG